MSAQMRPPSGAPAASEPTHLDARQHDVARRHAVPTECLQQGVDRPGQDGGGDEGVTRARWNGKGTMAESTSETPVLYLLTSMTVDSITASSLDSESLMLVRIAALVAVDASPVSYMMNIEAAGESGCRRRADPGRPCGDRADRRHRAHRVRDGE